MYSILGNTSELRPEKSEIEEVIQNRSGKDVKLEPCTKIGTVITANIVLTTQVSNDFDGGEQDGSDEPKDILQILICLEWRSGNCSCNKMLRT